MTAEELATAEQMIEESGFAVLRGVLATAQCEQIAADLQEALSACGDEGAALRRANGVIYGARNLLKVFPPARTLWGEFGR